MKRFYAERLVSITRHMVEAHRMAADPRAKMIPVGRVVLPRLDEIIQELREVDLRFSVKLAQRMRDDIDRGVQAFTAWEYGVFLLELERRIDDELEETVFMRVTADTAKYFDARPLFGTQVETQFHSVVLEIEEAGRCLALGRHTACVFHLSRVLGPALEALGRALGVNVAVPAWQGILDRITKELEKRNNQKDPGWLAEEPFYSTAAAFLLAVKIAWRNPVVHDIEHIYDADKATEVLETVKTFMRHISTKLGEQP